MRNKIIGVFLALFIILLCNAELFASEERKSKAARVGEMPLTYSYEVANMDKISGANLISSGLYYKQNPATGNDYGYIIAFAFLVLAYGLLRPFFPARKTDKKIKDKNTVYF